MIYFPGAQLQAKCSEIESPLNCLKVLGKILLKIGNLAAQAELETKCSELRVF